MSLFFNWPSQWVFVPNSLDSITSSRHSLADWTDVDWRPIDMVKILNYLTNTPVYIYSFAPSVECAICGVYMKDASIWHWDGEWLWPHFLHHMVQDHSVRLPDRMIESIRHRDYCPPSEDQCDQELAERIYQEFVGQIR